MIENDMKFNEFHEISNIFFKISTDFGLEAFRHEESEKEDQKKMKDIVYCAPELGSVGCRKSAEGDVYAFAIILIEIATRQDPYGVCL